MGLSLIRLREAYGPRKGLSPLSRRWVYINLTSGSSNADTGLIGRKVHSAPHIPGGRGRRRTCASRPTRSRTSEEGSQVASALASGETDATAKLADAQFRIAREYGCASWRQLKAEVERRASGPSGPPSVHVWLWYDDVTPKDFVLGILEEVFQKEGEPRRLQIMLGTGQSRVLGGVYPRDESDRLADRVAELAAKKNFPL